MFASSISFMPPTILIDISLMAILVVVAFAIVRMRSLFGIVMLQGVYSLVCAAWFVNLDAVDVAFTEAAVGAGVSTVLMLSAMLLADRKSAPVPISRQWGPLLICIFAGAAMFYAIGDMPAYGDAYSAANSYVGMDYMAKTAEEIKIPNVVTAVLASYRGYDTFGEAVVIFSAGLGVLLLLGLNGNAGRWVARPNGQRVTEASAPAAQIQDENPQLIKSNPVVEKTAVKTPLAKAASAAKAPAKKAATKKPAAKKPATKKPAAKKAPVKKAPAKKTAVKKAPAKKAPAKKAPAKKTATKKSVSKAAAAKSATQSTATPKRRGRPPKAAAKTPPKSGGKS